MFSGFLELILEAFSISRGRTDHRDQGFRLDIFSNALWHFGGYNGLINSHDI